MFENLERKSVYFIFHGVPGAKSGTANTVVTVPCPTPLHTPQTSDMPIAGAMIANSYVRHSNLCWDYTIQQLARLMN